MTINSKQSILQVELSLRPCKDCKYCQAIINELYCIYFQSVGELSLLASGTAVQLGSQALSLKTDKKHKGQLVKGKLAAKTTRQALSDPGLAVTLEPIVASGISVHLPPVDVD